MANPAVAMSQHAVPSRYDGLDKMLLNGTWRSGRSGQISEDREPFTDEVLVRVPLADERDLDEGFSAAAAAQPSWNRLLPSERSAIMMLKMDGQMIWRFGP
jgi:aldehyde dehydrogenase (NAD+)